jgi:hypothetical protein
MDIKQLYREETELDVYTVALMEQRVEHFSDNYVKWLEEQLILSGLSNSVVCSHESYAYTLNNDSKICDDCDAIFE